jgi:hypothetical protein
MCSRCGNGSPVDDVRWRGVLIGYLFLHGPAAAINLV